MSFSSCCGKPDRRAARATTRIMCAVDISRRALVACAFLLAVLQSGPVLAAGWRDDMPQARLQGQAGLRWFGLKIYDAALWSATTPFDPEQQFALELTYQRSISRTRIVQASVDEIRRLFGDRYDDARLKRWEADMERLFIDVHEGDQLTGVYLPGAGCRFYSRTQLLGEVRDPEFARAFFAIWLDPRTKDTQLRNRLLGTEK